MNVNVLKNANKVEEEKNRGERMFQEEVEKQRAEGEKEFRRQVIFFFCIFICHLTRSFLFVFFTYPPGGGGPGDGRDELHAAGQGGQSGGGEAVQ